MPLVSNRPAWLFPAAAAAAVLWLSALGVLAATTANPPVLNRWQIGRADCIVEADGQTVFAVLKGDCDPNEVVFARTWDDGSRRLVPLEHTASGDRVLEVRFDREGPGNPITYPATAKTRAMLQAALAE